MTSPKAGRRDFDQLERRRMEGAKLLHRGISQAEVARRCKVSRESVRRWQNLLLLHGSTQGLKKAGRAGRKPQLDASQLHRLEAILRAGAEKAGFPNGLWTLNRIAQLVEEEFGVAFHPGHVWWLLHHKLGWSCQRPTGRARERNEAAIRDWKENVWPELKKKRNKRVGSSSS